MAIALPSASIDNLRHLANELHVGDADLVLLGDGSAGTFDQPASWACISFELRQRIAYLLTGTVSTGTNNMAELLPYIQALWFHSQRYEKSKARIGGKVAVISDSHVTVCCGNREYQRNANLHLWAAIDEFELRSYHFHWVHVCRNSNFWHAWMDHVANVNRNLAVQQERSLATTAINVTTWAGQPIAGHFEDRTWVT